MKCGKRIFFATTLIINGFLVTSANANGDVQGGVRCSASVFNFLPSPSKPNPSGRQKYGQVKCVAPFDKVIVGDVDITETKCTALQTDEKYGGKQTAGHTALLIRHMIIKSGAKPRVENNQEIYEGSIHCSVSEEELRKAAKPASSQPVARNEAANQCDDPDIFELFPKESEETLHPRPGQSNTGGGVVIQRSATVRCKMAQMEDKSQSTAISIKVCFLVDSKNHLSGILVAEDTNRELTNKLWSLAANGTLDKKKMEYEARLGCVQKQIVAPARQSGNEETVN